MRRAFVVSILLVLSILSITCSATTIDTVPVGDPGNVGDSRYAYATNGYGPLDYGSVGYAYNVGKYEVTAAQYTDFLNKVAKTYTYGLYTTEMSDTSLGSGITRGGVSGSYTYSVASDFINRPVNYVSWGDSARFANWLHNGQPTGAQDLATTEDGAYYLNGATTNAQLLAVNREAGWTWAITSEDEWYKAAYYKGGSTSAGYWDYPTSSDTAPGQDMADVSGNNANYWNGYDDYPIDSGKYTTVAGEFQNSASPYGTFDQGGNVWEWNEGFGTWRGLRGGSYMNNAASYLSASNLSYYWGPTTESSLMGFRVAEAIPEPTSLIALGAGVMSLLGLRRRRA